MRTHKFYVKGVTRAETKIEFNCSWENLGLFGKTLYLNFHIAENKLCISENSSSDTEMS